MIYRIDLKHYLAHMVDYFTTTELLNFYYIIISSDINVNFRVKTVIKLNDFYPTEELVVGYKNNKDKDQFRRGYFQMLTPTNVDKQLQKRGQSWWVDRSVYLYFVNTLMKHQDVIIVCRDYENDYIDILVEYLKKQYNIEVVNLNDLFAKGHVGSLYIDLDKIRKTFKDERKRAAKDFNKSKFKNDSDKLNYIRRLSKKEKIKALKNSSIEFTKADEDHLDELLVSVWDELMDM